MTTEQELKHYKKVLERIRDWEFTSKGSCNILRGFARKALEDIDKTCLNCARDPLDLWCATCDRNLPSADNQKRYDYFKAISTDTR